MAGPLSLNLSYFKSNPKSHLYLVIYRSAGQAAKITEQEMSLLSAPSESQWKRVAIPLKNLAYKPISDLNLPKPKKVGPRENLALQDTMRGDLFAVELGLDEGKEKDRLYFDRLALGFQEAASRELEGEVKPATAAISISIDTGNETHAVVTDARGKFRWSIPSQVERVAVATYYKGIWRLPTQGRYLEVGSHPPPLVIPLEEAPSLDFSKLPPLAPLLGSPNATSEQLSELYETNTYFFRGFKNEYFVERDSNGNGYLDRDRRFENPDQAFRVAFLGSCYTEGQQVSSQSLFSAQAEAMSHFSDVRPVEVLSFGVNSVVLTQWWPAFLKHVLKYKPDLIILGAFVPWELKAGSLEEMAEEYGFSPKHPRNHFFAIDPKTNRLLSIPHDPDWQIYSTERHKPKVAWNDEAVRADQSTVPKEIRKAEGSWLGG